MGLVERLLTISQAAKADIAAALNANKEVTVHQAPITYAGWTGEGYTVIDPTTGAGAYKISGGGNGGATVGQSLILLGLMITVSLSGLAFLTIGAIVAVAGGIGAMIIAMAVALGSAYLVKESVEDAVAVIRHCQSVEGAFRLYVLALQEILTELFLNRFEGIFAGFIMEGAEGITGMGADYDC